MFFYKFWKRLLVKRLLVKSKKKNKLSILHRLRITQTYVEDWILRCLSYQLQLDVYHILLHPKLKMKFYTHGNPNLLKKYMANCLSYLTVSLCLSFLSHNHNSVYTIFTSKNWIAIPVSLRNGKISYSTLALNFKDWPFGIIATRHFRPKSGHLNDRVYCKPIGRKLKRLLNESSGSFLRPTIPEFWKLLAFG